MDNPFPHMQKGSNSGSKPLIEDNTKFDSHVFCKKNQFISHMKDNTKLHPKELNITFAELNQEVN